MATGSDSGKMEMLKGTLAYLWEEMKTMNRRKLRAMTKIVSGYVRMKLTARRTRRAITEQRSPVFKLR